MDIDSKRVVCEEYEMRSIRRATFLILSCLTLTTLYIFTTHLMFTHHPRRLPIVPTTNPTTLTASSEATNTGQVCIPPKLMLWHPELEKYFTDPPPLKCSQEENWAYSEKGRFRISDKASSKPPLW